MLRLNGMTVAIPCGDVSAREAGYGFFGASALLFAMSATVTVMWSLSMAGMGEIPMPGGWAMSMTWTLMCGQTWFGAAAAFVGMWSVMMAAMMLPSLMPVLWRYRQAVTSAGATRIHALTPLMGAGYFFIWTLLGVAIFPLGAGLAEVLAQSPALARAAPVMAGLVVLLAGALQFTPWKARLLACCRMGPTQDSPQQADVGAAWRYGLRHGLHCSGCCAGPTAILLVVGVMDLRAMTAMAVGITAERLMPGGERVARAIGAGAVGAGLLLIARAVGLT